MTSDLLLSNPVLQRELLSSLRRWRSFFLLLVYVGLLGAVVCLAWPQQASLDLTSAPAEARRLVKLFFLGQFVLIAIFAPALTAGSIAGERERETLELLLASPVRPLAIVVGKLLASLAHLSVLLASSAPMIALVLLLGGMHLVEALAVYAAMAAAVVVFGAIALACSCRFGRTAPAAVVAYLIVLPLVLAGIAAFELLEPYPRARLWTLAVGWPAAALALAVQLAASVRRQLLSPEDARGEPAASEPEQPEAGGMVLQWDRFPDRLFAPSHRGELLPDGANPVYDKEIRSELFGRGTLMLRLVIQLSMGLAWAVMALALFIYPHLAAWYAAYVLLFAMLVSPVFAAGAVTGERERQTLELLLTTPLNPLKILAAKLVAALRVGLALTALVACPVVLAMVLLPTVYWQNRATLAGYFAVIVLTTVTAAVLALAVSVAVRKTVTATAVSYLALMVLFVGPLAAALLAGLSDASPAVVGQIEALQSLSPFAVVFRLPLVMPEAALGPPPASVLGRFAAFYTAFDIAALLFAIVCFRFRRRRGLL